MMRDNKSHPGIAVAFFSAALLMILMTSIVKSDEPAINARDKLGSNLLIAIDQRSSHRTSAAGGPSIRLPHDATGRVTVDITADVSPAVLQEIANSRGTIISAFPKDHAIRAQIPLEKLPGIATNPAIKSVRLAAHSHFNSTEDPIATAPADPEGDTAHLAAEARSTYGATGATVKIGVISDSIDDYSGQFTGSNDLLETAYNNHALDKNLVSILTIDDKGVTPHLQDGRGLNPPGHGEGLAMMEIIHRIAPMARLEFASGGYSAASMARNIRGLAASGCSIIVDDASYDPESPFQADAISRAVDDVTSHGVLYFSAAGNYGNKKSDTSSTFEGFFNDGGPWTGASEMPQIAAGARYFAFHAGVSWNEIKANDRASSTVNLFWNDPLRRSKSQYDLYLYHNGTWYSSVSKMTGETDPYQTIDVSALTNDPSEMLNVGDRIVVVREAGTASRFIHLDTDGAKLEYATDGSTRGHSAASSENAFSVGARGVPPPTPQNARFQAFSSDHTGTIEPFSSDGPRLLFYSRDGKKLFGGSADYTKASAVPAMKPDFIAADNVTTTVPGLSPNPESFAFMGTSAAAPHAAAIAALIMSAHQDYSPAQVRLSLMNSVIITNGTFDETTGFGTIMAPTAVKGVTRDE